MARRGKPRTGGIRTPPGGVPPAYMLPAPDVVIDYMEARSWLADNPPPDEPSSPQPRKEPEMAQIPPGPVREEVESLKRQVSGLRTETAQAILQLREEIALLRAELGSAREEVAKLWLSQGVDDANERIVAFLEALGGVKLNGMSIAQNLGMDPGTTANRLQRLARDGRVVVHRERNRHSLYSIPLK